MAKLKVGLIGGGGPGNFFGGVHKRAISLDGSRELVAGALRSDPDAAMVAAVDYGIEGFPDYRAMINACVNGALELDYVTIVTPNHAHFAPAKAFLEAGIPVLCENYDDGGRSRRAIADRRLRGCSLHSCPHLYRAPDADGGKGVHTPG